MKKLNKYLLVIPMLASGFILPGAALAECLPTGTIYVNANAGGINDGSDWANAYTSLQDALGAAVSGEEIWVATGIYYPDIGTAQTDDDRDVSFELAFCVAIYGGFAGGETSLDDRDWETNVTTLSGDIDQDDDSDGGDNSGNSQHVVTGIGTAANPIDGTAILDGVVISGGNTANNGGGMYNIYSSPTITNITISGNSAGR